MFVEELKDYSKLSLSFSGCGFLCVYHAGVCAAIREFAPHLLKVPILGASAGSILGACITSDVCLSKAISVVLDVVAKARSFTFGALNRDFDLMRIVRKNLEEALPENAHELCSGRLHVSITRFSDYSNRLVSEFHSRQDLIDAIVCSCFIPVYGGFDYPRYQGEKYIDGGISVNQPILDSNTITISPFAGENDICPSDVDSANLLGLMFSGTSIRFTMSNLMRLLVCLFPPPAEACSKICQQGFEDALRYLFLNGLSPCGSCLNVQADLLECETGGTTQVEAVIVETQSSSKPLLQKVLTRRSILKKQKGSECRLCLQSIDPLVKPPFARLFPKLIKQAFDEALKGQRKGFFYSLRIVRLARTLLLPVLLCLQLFKFWKSFSFWFMSYAINDWLLVYIEQTVKQLFKEIRREHTAEINLEEIKVDTPDSAVNESSPAAVPIFEAGDYENVPEECVVELASKLFSGQRGSLRRSEHSSSLHHYDFNESIPSNKYIFPEQSLTSVTEDVDKCWLFCNQDGYYKAIELIEEHENVVAFYYMDEASRAHFCQLHGVDQEAMLKAISVENSTST